MLSLGAWMLWEKYGPGSEPGARPQTRERARSQAPNPGASREPGGSQAPKPGVSREPVPKAGSPAANPGAGREEANIEEAGKQNREPRATNYAKTMCVYKKRL